jgi:hypothetical protein
MGEEQRAGSSFEFPLSFRDIVCLFLSAGVCLYSLRHERASQLAAGQIVHMSDTRDVVLPCAKSILT